jgi:hypothetical protein
MNNRQYIKTNKNMSNPGNCDIKILIPPVDTIDLATFLSEIISSIDISHHNVILDQGRLGTCVSTSMSTVISHMLKKQCNISRLCLQFKENMVYSGLNPNVISKLNLFEIGQDIDYTQLYETGAFYSWGVIALAYGACSEETWEYPEVSIAEFNNFIYPLEERNPLLKHDYDSKLDKYAGKCATVYSVNYGINSYKFDTHHLRREDDKLYLNKNAYNKLNEMYLQEVSLLVIDANTALRQSIFIMNIYDNLLENKPSLVSFLVPKTFAQIDKSGLIILEQSTSSLDIIGGHCATLFGLLTRANLIAHYACLGIDKTSQLTNTHYFKMADSYGTHFGDNGYLYVGVNDFLTAHIDADISNTIFTPTVFTIDRIKSRN